MSLIILALESATEYGSIALSFEDRILTRASKAPKQHSLWILPAVEMLLAEAGLTKKQLNAISFGRGPGSFTGIRLAMSVAQTIAFALNIPVIPISTLQTLAQQAWRINRCTEVFAALDAKLHQVYWGHYRHNPDTGLMQSDSVERVEDPKQIEWSNVLRPARRGIGNGWELYPECFDGEVIAGCYPKAYDMITIARWSYQQGHVVSAAAVKPLYLRDKVAQVTV
jgi:tRNA threonylcarbamoyladenosine biosynthesis protein TsaB